MRKCSLWRLRTGVSCTKNEIEMWQAFMTGPGCCDARTQRLNERLAEIAESCALATKQSVALALEEP